MKNPIQHVDGRWLYDSHHLFKALRKMPDKTKARILLKALKIVDEQNTTKENGLAQALGCIYDEISCMWARKQKIRVL